MRTWFNNLLKPANLFDLASLIIAAFGTFAGIKFFSNNQTVTGDNECEINTVEQEISDNTNSNQNINCDNKSKITGVTQKQTK